MAFRKVFVVAAHPDDDTIGCGGFMSLTAAVGGIVSVVYLSDGSRSHPGSTRFPPARVAEIRATEARAALKILGVREAPRFFELTDGTLATLDAATRRDTVARLALAIAVAKPDIVLAPWRRDPHPDHVAAASITAGVLATFARPPRHAGYEVWLPIRGSRDERPQPGETTTRTIRLDPETIERKRRALSAHRSQTSNLIDDDPSGFRIDEALFDRWLQPVEYLHETCARAAT